MLDIELIRSAVLQRVRTVPFRRFVLNVDNGERVLIARPECLAFDPAEGGAEDFAVLSGGRRLFGTFAAIADLGPANDDGPVTNADTFRDLLRRSPFEAVRVVMDTGESYDVTRPDIAFATASSLILALPDPPRSDGERLVFCSYIHVAHVEVLKPSRAA